MSKALICDRCGKAFTEQVALSMDAKWQFIHTHYDLCPECHKAFKEKFMKEKRKENVHGEGSKTH